jgi:CheY-like chemotaxis protein
MAAALSAQAQAKGVSLRLAWRPDSPRRVTGDPGRLRQILAALVGDGLTRIDRGEIVLEVARAASKSSSGGVRFVVEDSGPGIPADLLPTLFEPFTRGDLNPSRDAGLGLPIAQQLARLMGGELEVVNLEGSGTRFSVGIPLTAVDEPVARPLTSGPDSPGMGGRAPNRAALLVVEADPDQRASWAAIAEAAGYQATGLGDRDEAVAELLRLAEAGRPAAAVIFSDHDAEDYDTVGRKLLGDERYGHPALIMLPAVGNPGDARRLREAGYRSYLVKPVVPADLREVLEVFRRIPREARHTLFLTRHSLAEARRGADGSDSEVEARLEHLIGANGETPEQ